MPAEHAASLRGGAHDRGPATLGGINALADWSAAEPENAPPLPDSPPGRPLEERGDTNPTPVIVGKGGGDAGSVSSLYDVRITVRQRKDNGSSV